MVDISSLAGNSGSTTIENLASTGQSVVPQPVANDATTKSLAAHAALLTDGPSSVDAYNKMVTDINVTGDSSTLNDITAKANENEQSLNKKAIVNILADDNVPMEQKVAIATGVRTGSYDPLSSVKTPQELLAINSSQMDGQTKGNARVDEVQLDMIGSIGKAVEYNNNIQQLINEETVKQNADSGVYLANLAETFIPFMESAAVGKVKAHIRQDLVQDGSGTTDFLSSLVGTGESKQQIIDYLKSQPIDQRLKVAQNMRDLIVNSNGTIIPYGKNSMLIVKQLNEFLGGDYTLGDRVMDDVASAMDLFGLGAETKAIFAGNKARKAVAEAARIQGHNPASVVATVANTNAKSFNGIVTSIALDDTGKVAEALANSTREDAIVANVGPEILLPDGTVRHKPLVLDPEFNPDMATVKVVSRHNSIILTPEEKASKLAVVQKDFTAVPERNVNPRQGMTQIGATDDGVHINTVFGPREGGFTDPADAIEQVKVAARKYGIQDEEITLLKRAEDGTYKPVELKAEVDAAITAKGPPMQGPPLGPKPVVKDLYARAVNAMAERGFSSKSNLIKFMRIKPSTADKLIAKMEEDGIISKPDTRGRRTYYGVPTVEKPPVKASELGKGDYLVQIRHTSLHDAADEIKQSTTTADATFMKIPLNLTDKAPRYTKGEAGSIVQHLIPPSAVIDPILTRAASVAADYVARSKQALLKLGGEYASLFKKMNKADRQAVDNYIIKANHESLKFDPIKMKADGMSDAAIETVRQWKRTNDTIFQLENLDMARQSRLKGWEIFEDGKGLEHRQVRPMALNKVGTDIKKVYDAELGMIREIGPDEVKALYDDGGTLAKSRMPVEIGDQAVDVVIVKQKPGSYTRAIRDTDQLLNYRDGHFTIYYKDNVFIREHLVDANGVEYVKAIKTSGNTKEGLAHLKQLQDEFPDRDFTITRDRSEIEKQDLDFNSSVNTGRTAQRTRGETLRDVTDRPSDLNFAHMASPEESLVKSIQSIAQRVNMKEYLDTVKRRFMEQYKQYLPTDKETHMQGWPDDRTMLVRPTDLREDLSQFHEAVTTYNYIHSMEKGYINMVDDISKNLFQAIADTAGRKGWSWLEKAAEKGSEFGPTNFARKQAFRILLASNPIRQVVIQAMQAVPVILATNPKFLASKMVPQMYFLRILDRGGDVNSILKGASHVLSGLTEAEARAMAKHYEESGISSMVKAHSIISDDLVSLVDRGVWGKTKAIAGKPLDLAQRYGFEPGENALMKMVWLSEYDLMRANKVKMTDEALTMLHARVRDLTGNMNKAGELAYNENALSVIMQFFQAPHKIFSQVVLGNRALTQGDRAKLGLSYLLTYGTGSGMLYSAYQGAKGVGNWMMGEDASDTADNKELDDAIQGGFFNFTMNHMLSAIYGDPVNVDFSASLRQIDPPTLNKLWANMATMDIASMIGGSPSIGLYASGGKLHEFLRALARPFTVPEDDGNLADIGASFIGMFGGLSAVAKARYILSAGKVLNAKGEVLKDNVNTVEAWMSLAGFKTEAEVHQQQANEDAYFISKKFKDDFNYMLDETGRRLVREGISDQESEYVIRMMQEATRWYGDNPYAMQAIQSEITKRGQSGDYRVVNKLIELSKIATRSQIEDVVNKSGLSQDQRDNVMKIFKFMRELN